MKTITVPQAFGIAVPRRPAVLCIKGPDGTTDMIMTHWFNWLNLKRNPMITYAMETTVSLGLNVSEKDTVYLAFPPVKDALLYKAGIRTARKADPETLPEGIDTELLHGVPVLVPRGSQAVLQCTVTGSYKYPFKKVRIYHCDLEEARGETGEVELD